MEHKSVELETAKELTLKLIENGKTGITVEHLEDPEAIGKVIATLYNTILENLRM